MSDRDGTWPRNPLLILVRAAVTLVTWSTLSVSPSLAESPREASPATEDVLEIEEILAQIAGVPGLSARFREERRLSILERPLVTRGTVHFAPPDRLIRRVDEPSASLLVLNGSTLILEDSRGRKRLDVDSLPTLRVFADSFRLILAGRLAELREVYRIRREPRPDDGGWRLRLEPRLASLGQIISAIEVEGIGQTLREIQISEVGGDSTLIQFSQINANRRFSQEEIVRLFHPPEP